LNTLTVGINTDTIRSAVNTNFDVGFDAVAKRWRFKVQKGNGLLRAYWGYDLDENGDIMPFAEDE
jgi:hypothetical protein